MTLAARIDPWLAARAARAAAVAARRVQRDTFIQAQFPLLLARFEALLLQALGLHSGFALTSSALTLLVSGRSFATLDVTQFAVRAGFMGAPQTVRFTPALDFRDADQFGLLECSIDFDFDFVPRAACAAAQALIDRGVALGGAHSASLRVQRDGRWRDLTADDLEAALARFWLRP